VARKIFIGDKVETAWGVGIVHDARSWREAIVGMDDYEAVEFSDKCKVEVGIDYKDVWVELLVVVRGMKRRVLGTQVVVLEGRDDATT